MGLHKFMMKHGVGSPGYIASRVAEAYRFRKARDPKVDDRTTIRAIFVERVAAQSLFGGPRPYKLLRGNTRAIEELVDHHPDLFSIIMLTVFIEHPELVGPFSRSDSFDVLIETVREVLNSKAPGWRTAGVWNRANIVCADCSESIPNPDPSRMYVAFNEEQKAEYLCAQCTMPLPMRAMSDLGYFMGDRFR